MCYLTSRQYSLLKTLIEVDKPLSMSVLGGKVKLSARQVNYNLQGVQHWLKDLGVIATITSGSGVYLECSLEQRQKLASRLASEKHVRLVLTGDERCQMLALVLLLSEESMILAQMQVLAGVTRTTALKDLDAIDDWFKSWDVVLERRPNFGYRVNIPETKRRQMVQALLWGCTPFGEPLLTINYKEGLKFVVQLDPQLLPIVAEVTRFVKNWNARKQFVTVAFAESQLGGRFTDESVLQLGLAFAIQAQRVHEGKYAAVAAEQVDFVKSHPLWSVAVKIALRLAESPYEKWPDEEIASIVMVLLSAARNERWPGDLGLDSALEEMLTELMLLVTKKYPQNNLAEDRILYDGIVNLLFPAYYRQRFGIWLPKPPPDGSMIEQYARDVEVASEMVDAFFNRTGMRLADEIVVTMAMLLRASILREQADLEQQILVICPSGMATAQLLVARLKVYFPGLGTYKVISMRDLTPQAAIKARLILTTVPLPAGLAGKVPVLQVHPLLMPENITAITNFLGS
jgi:mannitol operon transcriptional antiterminator